MSDRNHVVSPFEVEFLLGLYYGSSRRPKPCRALDMAMERFTREGLIDSTESVRLTRKGKEYVKAILNTPIGGVCEAPASAKEPLPNKPHKHHDFIVAWAKGEEVEYRPAPDGGWYRVQEDHIWSDPNWGATEYRLKPKIQVSWALLYVTPKGAFIGGSYPSKEQSLKSAVMGAPARKVVKIVKIEIDPETHEITSCETQDI